MIPYHTQKLGFRTVRHDLGKNLAVPFQEADHRDLLGGAPPTLAAHPPRAKIALIDLNGALAERGGLGFLQFPIAVGQRFVVKREFPHLPLHPAQPHAQGGERDASHREQEAGADRKGVGIVTRALRTAAGDEAIGAAERGREDHERADREYQPRKAPGETA